MAPDAKTGLTSTEAAARLGQHGRNELPPPAATPVWRRLLRQFQSPLIYILLFAVGFDLVAWVAEGRKGIPFESVAIAAILVLNAGLGMLQEQRSERALAKLKELAAPLAWALRDGRFKHLPSAELVPGDLIRLSGGERVAADGHVVEGRGVLVDESVLTGESVPVDKGAGEALFSGTLLVRGNALAEVERTGPASSLGGLAAMLGQLHPEPTPLEKRLATLGHQIALAVGALTVVLTVAGIAAEGWKRFVDIVVFAVALAVAAVPEGMPAVVTLTLALGVQRMARRNAVVRRLAAVEALGSVTTVATDKTGTLTESRMRVHALEVTDDAEALRALVLANDADVLAQAGDPLELGLLAHAQERGLDVAATRARNPRIDGRAFDSAWKFMRATVESERGVQSYLKGAPEVLLARTTLSPEERTTWAAKAEAAADGGYRVLALARGEGQEEQGLSFLGLVLLWDPARAEVPDAIRIAQAAGVRVVMITGDHPGTARAVARAIGMRRTEVRTGADLDQASDDALRSLVREASVFARVSPQHKLRLIEALKANGEVVAMTGDGVNDSPSLRRAHVGIAMGQRGSDVAREVADLVLVDDNFASIVGAIEEGRRIYENIKAFIRFSLSTNVALVLLVLAGTIGAYLQGLRDARGVLIVPLTALQLLWINFLGDGASALALAVDKPPRVMERPPTPPTAPLIDGTSRIYVLLTGTVNAALGALLFFGLPRWGVEVAGAQTALFLFSAIAKLASAYPARRLTHPARTNWALHTAMGAGIVLQLLALHVPALREILGLVMPSPEARLACIAAMVLSWAFAELVAAMTRRHVAGPRGGEAAPPHARLSRSAPA